MEISAQALQWRILDGGKNDPREAPLISVKAYEGLIRNYQSLASELDVSIDGCDRRAREEKLIVAAYERWGTDMGLHLNGQFALALYDDSADQLFCARDILGAELFFYYVTAEGKLLYATQIKDLFDQDGFVRKLNEDMVQFYMGFTYLPGEETLFEGVWKLAPGGYLLFDQDGLKKGTYWELSFEPDESKTLDDWADEISAAMDESLACVIDADQTPDSFLSGGVDSSYILAKSRARMGVCAAYENQQASEEDQARETATYLGREFTGVTVSPTEFLDTLDEFLTAFEIPTADMAALSLYCAAKQMVGKSEVCFSGEGADEFFAGYSVYTKANRYKFTTNPVYHGTTYIMAPSEQKRFVKTFNPGRSTRDFMRERGAAGRKYDTVGWMLYTDLRSYFEGSILYNSTKISRGTGLDIRMPYCDLRIFEISRRMPTRFKVSDEGNKLALRKAASRVLPQEVAYRKKLGFPVPVRAWMATPEYQAEITKAFESETAKKFFQEDELQALLNAFLGKKPKVHRLWYKRHEALLWRYVWTIFTFIRWYDLFFKD